MTKIKLLNCKDIYKYASIYQAVYKHTCDFTISKLDLITKRINMLVQVAMLLNTRNKYIEIISIVELEWKNGITDLESTIF